MPIRRIARQRYRDPIARLEQREEGENKSGGRAGGDGDPQSLPRQLRRHVHAVYAFCRWADDLADESGGAAQALDLLPHGRSLIGIDP